MLTSKEERICYSYDATNQQFIPDAVLFPQSAEEISHVLKLANSENFPVTPRGAGSGFSGGSLPVEGGVVLSLERMNHVLEIDSENLIAIVEPGVVNLDLQIEAERFGLFFPPDPSSLKFCTIGGNIAECAGGPRAVKYGVTRDYVLGLEVVLPTGEIIDTGVKTLKGVVGYDLTRLIVGSEGTLGIVTRATLRLLPLPEAVKTMLVVFNDLSETGRAVSSIMNSRIIPSAIEFMDAVSIRCVEDSLSMGLSKDAEAILLIELDGESGAIDRQSAVVRDICMEHNAVNVRVASGKREIKDLWRIRRSISPSLIKLKPYKLNEDVVVPRSKIPDLIAGVRDIAGKKNIIIATFGHAGDGNIHINIMVDNNNHDELRRGKEAVEEVFRLTIGLGGTISGEHGVGTVKAPYIGMELKPPVIDVMKKIKQTLDPNGILNPGKIFQGSRE
ncbi:MAG: FAD-linked oxidase C-terminal domain-containing protein [Thermodesulfobacteriota bacterium]